MDIASMWVDSGSGLHDAYTGSCLFSLDANKSISGVSYTPVKNVNTEADSIHSDASAKHLEASSARTLCIPGMCAAEICTPSPMHISHKSTAMSLHTTECVPLTIIIRNGSCIVWHNYDMLDTTLEVQEGRNCKFNCQYFQTIGVKILLLLRPFAINLLGLLLPTPSY